MMQHLSFHRSVKFTLLAGLIAAVTGWSSAHAAAMPATLPTDDRQQRDIMEEQGCVVGAHIVDDRTGKPLADIRMSCFISGKDQQLSRYQKCQTDENGYFQVAVPKGSALQARWEDAADGSYLLDRAWLRQKGGNSSNYEYQPLRMDSVTGDKTDITLKLRLLEMKPFTGTVVNDKEQPIPFALIYFNSRIMPANADGQGTFTMRIPRGGEFALCILSRDRSLGAIETFSADAQTGRIVLKPTLTRKGRVTTPSGLAADHLKFNLDPKLNDESCSQLRQELITDAQGMFTAEHLVTDGKYLVSWSAGNDANRDYDYGTTEVDLAGIKDGDLVVFTARKYVNAIVGQVVDQADKPIADAKVTVEASTDLMTQDDRAQKSQVGFPTDKDGNFTIPRLADGELTLNAAAPGRKPAKLKTATDNVDCKITMRSLIESIFRATVKDAQGKPVAGAEIALYSQQYIGGKIETSKVISKTGEDGIVTFTCPAARTNRPEQFTQNVLLCDVPGFDLDVSGTSRPGEDIDAHFTLSQSATHWKGKIIDEKNQPVANAQIIVTGFKNRHDQHGNLPADGAAPASARFTSAADGTFELTRLPHNWVNIMITAPGIRTYEGYFDPQEDTSTGVKRITVKSQSNTEK